MSNNPNRHQSLSFEESVEDYKQRLITYEMELNEMIQEGVIPQGKYKRRQKHLKFLRKILEEICQEWESGKQSVSSDLHFPLPNLSICSLEEQRICRKQVEHRYKTLKNLVSNTSRLLKTITRILSGRSNPITLTISLSALRTSLTKTDAQMHVLKRSQKRIEEYTQTIMKEEKKALPVNCESMSNISLYKSFFYKIHEKNSKIRQLKVKAYQEKQRAGWMERWLKFQQNKLETYYTNFRTPSSASVHEFDRQVSMFIDSKTKVNHKELLQKDKNSLAAIRKRLRNSFRQRVREE